MVSAHRRWLAPALSLVTAGCALEGGDEEPTPVSDIVLRVEGLTAQRVIGAIEAANDRTFIVVDLHVAQRAGPMLPLDPALFSLALSEGSALPANEQATDALEDGCSEDLAVLAGAEESCSLAFEAVLDAVPVRLEYSGEGRTASVALEPLAVPSQCLFFRPGLRRSVAACFETCVAAACDVEVGSFLASCEVCFALCADDRGWEGCLCVTSSCGPQCLAAGEAFDRCAEPCLALCLE